MEIRYRGSRIRDCPGAIYWLADYRMSYRFLQKGKDICDEMFLPFANLLFQIVSGIFQ